mgnify:CR=1 FL=1
MKNRKSSYFEVISSLQFEACNDALKRIVPRIDFNQINTLIDEVEGISEVRKQRHQEGVAQAKNSGKYAGRKRIVVDPNLFRQVAEDFRNHKVTEEEAMHRTGIRSRSTFYRRLKEI